MSYADSGLRAPAMGWKGLFRNHEHLAASVLWWRDWYLAVSPSGGGVQENQSLFYFCFPDFYTYCIDMTNDIGFLFFVLIKFLWNIHLLKQERWFIKSCGHLSLSHVQFFVTPWTVAHQAPLSSRDLCHPGIEPRSLMSPALTGRFLSLVPPGKPLKKKEGHKWDRACVN